MRIAMWLLTRLDVDDALIGDLLEQRNSGRPRTWFWRQIAGAVASILTRDLAAHPFRTTMTVLAALLLRVVTFRVWRPYQASIDGRIIGPLIEVASAFGQHVWMIGLSLANSLLLVPAWFLTGFALVRLSRAGVPLFLALAVAFLLPGVSRQLHVAIASDIVGWLLPVQLTIFATYVGVFALSTLIGAASGLGQPAD